MSKLDFVMAQIRQAKVARAQNHLWRRFWAEHPLSADQCGLIADPGIGDHFLLYAFAREVRRKFELEVHIAGNPRFAFMTEMFPDVARFVAWPEALPGREFGAVHVAPREYTRFFQFELCRAIGYRDFHLLDAYRCQLGLTADALPAAPRPPSPAALTEADSYWRRNGFEPGRVAILVVDARATPAGGTSPAFWRAVAGRLAAAGIKSVINAGPRTPKIDGIAALPLPIDQLRALAVSAGRVCSVRSGLSDLLCGLPCRHVVLYADVDYFSGKLIEGTSIARFGLPHPPKEIVAQGAANEAAVADSIVNHLAPATAEMGAR